MDEWEIYGEKHQTKRLIMDLTEEDIDVISISSQEENQTKKLDNDQHASLERRKVSVVERRSPVLTTNRGFNEVLYNPILEIKEEQEVSRKEKHFESSESDEEDLLFPEQSKDEVEEDLLFPEQSKDIREKEQLVQSQLVKEKENQVNMQKLKPKQTEDLKTICPNSVELLSENNNSNDLEIINKTLKPINKLVSGNEVTRQFNLDTTKLDRTTINPTIESEVSEIRHEVSKTNRCTTKQIDNKNEVDNCQAAVVQPRSHGKIARRPIKMNMTTLRYLGLTNFPLRADKKINVRKLKRKQKIALSRAKQLAKKAWIRNVTKSLVATRKMARRQQSKSIPTEEKDEINVRRTMEASSKTSSNDIEQQLEKDEKTLLQKLKNELSNKQEILLRRQHIKHMREIVQQLEKENVGYKAADEQTGQRQLEIIRAINVYYQLKNESTMYEDNFVIKDQAGSDAVQCHVKFTIKDLRPEGYRGSRIFHTMYDLVEGRLTRRIAVVHANDGTQQVEQLPIVEIKPSTSGMAAGNKKKLPGKKRKISSEFNFMEEVQIPNEKKKKIKIDISSKALKHATANRTRGNDGKFKPTEEQITTSTNKQTRNKQNIISTKDVNFIPKNLQELSFEKKNFIIKMTKLPALNPMSTALLKPKNGNQLPQSQPAESAADEPQNPQIMNNNQAMATSSEEDIEK